MNHKMVQIYVLGLEQNKYYIGKTNNLEFRLEDHCNKNGSAWTQKYKPIKLIELIPNCTDYHEDMYTLMYMDKYGIDNVRGGSYVTIILDESTKKHLEKSSRSANNKCFFCGQQGHFVRDCPQKEEKKCERCGRNHSTSDCYAKTDINGKAIGEKCTRCGRNHPTSNCYAKTDINGSTIQKELKCLRCGRNGHDNLSCYETIDIKGSRIDDNCIIF